MHGHTNVKVLRNDSSTTPLWELQISDEMCHCFQNIFRLRKNYQIFFVHRNLNIFKIRLDTFRKYFLFSFSPALSRHSHQRVTNCDCLQQRTQNYGQKNCHPAVWDPKLYGCLLHEYLLRQWACRTPTTIKVLLTGLLSCLNEYSHSVPNDEMFRRSRWQSSVMWRRVAR